MDEEYKDKEEEQQPEENGSAELHSILYGGEYSEYGDALGSGEEEEERRPVKLKTFSSKETPEEPGKKQKIKTETSKKITTIIIVSAVIAAAVVLVAIFAPSWFRSNVEEPPVLYEGEVLSDSRRVMMFEHLERKQIQSVEVHNQYGEYTVYYNAETESFAFLGLEGAPYNEELFSQLIVAAGFPLISDRFLPGEERAELSEYGLGPDDSPSYYIVTTRPAEGEEVRRYKVLIGKPSLTENYYYCMVEGRDIVYILEQSIKTTLLADVKSLLTPILTYPIEDNSYLTNISQIMIAKNGELFVLVQYQDEQANVPGVENFGVTVPYIVTKPVEYDASTEKMTALLGQKGHPILC